MTEVSPPGYTNHVEMDAADSYVVVLVHPPSRLIYFSGPFPDPVVALAYADEWATEFTDANPDHDNEGYNGVKATVYPMCEPDNPRASLRKQS